MNTIIKLFRRGYELLVASGNLLQSPRYWFCEFIFSGSSL